MKAKSQEEARTTSHTFVDCLGWLSIALPASPIRAERCIATVVSAGYAALLDDMLGSLQANGGCQDALRVVFVVAPDDDVLRVVANHGVTVIDCTPLKRVGIAIKAVLYSIAHIVDAKQYLCLDSDIFVMGDLHPVFCAIEACRSGSIFVCRDVYKLSHLSNLEDALRVIYGGHPDDLVRLLGNPAQERSYPLVINDGFFAGDRNAFIALDRVIRGWPEAAPWIEEGVGTLQIRTQFISNLVLAHLFCGVELDPIFNIQLNWEDVDIDWINGHLQAKWQGEIARIVHFNGQHKVGGRRKYEKWRGSFTTARNTVR